MVKIQELLNGRSIKTVKTRIMMIILIVIIILLSIKNVGLVNENKRLYSESTLDDKLEFIKNEYYDRDVMQLAIKSTLEGITVDEQEKYYAFVIQCVLDKINEYQKDDEAKRNSEYDWTNFNSIESKSKSKRYNLAGKLSKKNLVIHTYGDFDYIKFPSFSKAVIDKLKSEILTTDSSGNISCDLRNENLIIDLRGNRGGLVDVASELLDLFFDEGIYLFALEADGREDEVYISEHPKVISGKNIYILTNRRTASCSEIFLSCMKRSGESVSQIGLTTYGKGIVSYVKSFDDFNISVLNRIVTDEVGNTFFEIGIVPEIIMDGINEIEIDEMINFIKRLS